MSRRPRPTDAHHILSGEDRSFAAAMLRTIAAVAEPFYRTAVAARNATFDAGLRRVCRAHVPVISIGNLTAGGTGKTPMVAYLVKLLRGDGLHPAIVMRGYKADRTGSDEAHLLRELCPGTPIAINADRCAAVERLRLDQREVNVIVLDDGFQHRRIARDLDIVLIDATNPFGYGRVLPRGLLRESPRGLRRADLVLVTRSDLIESADLAALNSRIGALHGRLPLGHAVFRWADVVAADDAPVPDAQQRVYAVAGVGNPQAFFTQARQRFTVVDTLALADHVRYDAALLAELAERTRAADCEAMLVTAKDWVKLAALLGESAAPAPIWRPLLRMDLGDATEAFEAEVLRTARGGC